MVEKLQRLLKNSYSPYSHFAVSAIVVMKDGSEFSGVNVENASYGASICAERSAIVSAISAGYGKDDFRSINIMVSSNKVSTCCFMCRQVINEFFSGSSLVHCFSITGEEKTFTVDELCTYPFSEDDLK